MKPLCASALVWILLSIASPLSLSSQVVPSATEGHSPFSAGAGISSFDVDWGHGRMLGETLWLDWNPRLGPALSRGLGLEMEARDISLGRSPTQQPNFRLDTAGGGVTYQWRFRRNLTVYGKYLIDLGSVDFNIGPPLPGYKPYTHDTRTVEAPGGGLEFRVFHGILLRADYEYQMWPDFLSKTLDPQGFTVGVQYDFRALHRR